MQRTGYCPEHAGFLNLPLRSLSVLSGLCVRKGALNAKRAKIAKGRKSSKLTAASRQELPLNPFRVLWPVWLKRRGIDRLVLSVIGEQDRSSI